MKNLLLTVLGLAFPIISYGQMSVESEPYALKNKLERAELLSLSVTVSPSKSISEAISEDKDDMQKGIPPRFGLKMVTDLNTNNSGVWTELEKGDKIWRLLIKSPGAKSINLLYDKFHLPSGARLHIYNYKMTHVIGGFTDANNKGTLKNPGMFATGLVYGDNVVLEYYHPREASDVPVISIAGVVHGYKYIELLITVLLTMVLMQGEIQMLLNGFFIGIMKLQIVLIHLENLL